jgi:hypothetical protein
MEIPVVCVVTAVEKKECKIIIPTINSAEATLEPVITEEVEIHNNHDKNLKCGPPIKESIVISGNEGIDILKEWKEFVVKTDDHERDLPVHRCPDCCSEPGPYISEYIFRNRFSTSLKRLEVWMTRHRAMQDLPTLEKKNDEPSVLKEVD